MSVLIACRAARRADLGVGEAQILGLDLIRSARLQTGGKSAVVDRGDPVKLRVVLRDRRPRALENRPEFYRAVSDRQTAAARCRRRHSASVSGASDAGASQRLGGRRAGRARQAAANTSPRRASSTATTTSVIAPQRDATIARSSASDASVETPTSGDPCALRQRARGRDPDPQPGERARADADGDPVEVRSHPSAGAPRAARRPAPAAASRAAALTRRRVVAALELERASRSRPVSQQRDRRRARRRVEPEDLHRRSTSITRRSPPACSSRTRAAIRARPDSAAPRRRPLDERDRVRAEVVGEQVGVLGFEARHAEQIDVCDRHGRRVALADRERRAGDGGAHAERAARAAHERRLARAKLALDEHHVARREAGASSAPSASVSPGLASHNGAPRSLSSARWRSGRPRRVPAGSCRRAPRATCRSRCAAATPRAAALPARSPA